MKVLIVKVSALGDVIHALPVLPYLKSADPQVEIDWLVEESFAPLIDGHPLLRKVHRLRTKAWRRQGAAAGIGGALDMARSLRRERYDVVLDLQGNSKSALFTILAGAPRRIGFDRHGVREWPNLLATNRKVTLRKADHHISDRSLAVARAAFPGGTESPQAGPLPVTAEGRDTVERLLREFGLANRKLVVLHYGTTWKTKLWPLDLWQDLAAALCEREGLQPVLTWGSEEERLAVEAIRDAAQGRAVVWPRGSLTELTALLQRADVVVGGDTGPVHIAAAVGTPTVSIFRVTDATRTGPRGPQHVRLQVPLDCYPCLQKACNRDVECGHSISAEQVHAAVMARIERMGE